MRVKKSTMGVCASSPTSNDVFSTESGGGAGAGGNTPKVKLSQRFRSTNSQVMRVRPVRILGPKVYIGDRR